MVVKPQLVEQQLNYPLPTPLEVLVDFGVTPEMLSTTDAIINTETTLRIPLAFIPGATFEVNASMREGDAPYVRRNIFIDAPAGDLWIKTYQHLNGEEFLRQCWIRTQFETADGRRTVGLELSENNNGRIHIIAGSPLSNKGRFTIVGDGSYLLDEIQVQPASAAKIAAQHNLPSVDALQIIPAELLAAMLSGQLHMDVSPWLLAGSPEVNIVSLGNFQVPVRASLEA